jgi:hypothetical protein
METEFCSSVAIMKIKYDALMEAYDVAQNPRDSTIELYNKAVFAAKSAHAVAIKTNESQEVAVKVAILLKDAMESNKDYKLLEDSFNKKFDELRKNLDSAVETNKTATKLAEDACAAFAADKDATKTIIRGSRMKSLKSGWKFICAIAHLH